MNRRQIIQSAVLGLAAPRLRAAGDPLSWDAVMAQKWERPAKLAAFSKIHPRLFLSGQRIAALRAKLGGTHREVWEIVKENADRHLASPVPSNYKNQGDMREAGRGVPWLALAFLMTGRPEYDEGARKWMRTICEFPQWENGRSLAGGECLFGIGTGYDWLYENLAQKERAFIRQKLVQQAELMHTGPPVHHDRWLANHNHVEHLGLAAAGFALFDEEPRAADWIRQSDLVFRAMFKLAAEDGSSTEGHQYWAYTTEAALRYIELARDLLGANYYTSEWLKNAPNFIIHSTPPGFDAENCVMSFGDSHREYSSHGPTHILYRLAAEYRNRHAQWLAMEMQRRRVGRDAYCAWANLLWYDETVEPEPLSRLPVFWNCGDIGWITARSDWRDNAVMVGFKCGPMHGHRAQRYYEENRGAAHEIGGGHGHPDVNSFQIYARRKWLAIDPMYERPKWTRTHNCILVNGRGQLGEGQTWFDRDAVLAAGASSAMVKAEHTPECDYMVGDAMNIYPPEAGLRKFHRHFLFVRPDIVLVADDLEADPPAVFEWLLQAESTVEEKGSGAFLVSNGDVRMDVRFVLPSKMRAKIEGRTLRAILEPSRNAVIAAVLHPRASDAPAAAAELISHSGGRLDLTIGTSGMRHRVTLDMPRRRAAVQNR
jgi:hypothetical protein